MTSLLTTSRAVLYGLEHRSDLNGRLVTMQGLQASGRHKVKVEKSGEEVLVKPGNLRPFSDAMGYGGASGSVQATRSAHDKAISCSECGMRSLNNKSCAGCRITVYCSRECQRAAWPAHKAFCREQQSKSKMFDQSLAGASAEDLYHLALAKSSHHKLAEARDLYHACLAKDPHKFVAACNLASILRTLGDNEAAIEVLVDAINRVPSAGPAAFRNEFGSQPLYVLHETLGNALTTAGNLMGAEKTYEKAIELAETLRLREPGAHIQLAHLYEQLGQPDKCLAKKRENAREFPDSYLCLYNLGCELRRQQPLNFEEALQCFESALKTDDGQRDADVHAMLGVTLLDVAVVRRESPSKAVTALENALKQDRHHPAAIRNLKKARIFAADSNSLRL